jgi:hypothetical protein
MNISSKKCEEFRKNPKVNPLTGRSIMIGKITHRKLIKACNERNATVVKSMNNIAPPMGPMMHWRINKAVGNQRLNNLIKMSNFIEERLLKMEKETMISRMEIEEFQDILRDAIHEFIGRNKYLDFFNELLDKIKTLKKTKTITEDRPKYKIVDRKEVKPDRYSIRENILSIWSIYNSSLNTIENTIKTNKVNYNIPSGVIRDLKRDKVYLDYLIKHNIFSYDDIYKYTFKSEKVFDELAERYKIYRKIYKETEGESPL